MNTNFYIYIYMTSILLGGMCWGPQQTRFPRLPCAAVKQCRRTPARYFRGLDVRWPAVCEGRGWRTSFLQQPANVSEFSMNMTEHPYRSVSFTSVDHRSTHDSMRFSGPGVGSGSVGTGPYGGPFSPHVVEQSLQLRRRGCSTSSIQMTRSRTFVRLASHGCRTVFAFLLAEKLVLYFCCGHQTVHDSSA